MYLLLKDKPVNGSFVRDIGEQSLSCILHASLTNDRHARVYSGMHASTLLSMLAPFPDQGAASGEKWCVFTGH